MRISRREFATLAGAAMVVGPASARAGAPNIFVPGFNLPANLDPHQILDVGATGYALNAYDNLYRYEDNPPKMQPWLAAGHAVSPDGLVWDFKLRPGVKFHDGTEVTADDVVYSVRRLLAIGKAPSAPFLPILKPSSVTAPDRYSVRFQLDQPYGPFFAMIPMVAIVNPRVVRRHEKDGDWAAGWLASNQAGSGAYRLIPETYVPLEHVDMERNEDHFQGWSDNPRPVQRIEWRPTQVDVDAGIGVAQRIARHDRQQSAGRSGRTHRQVTQCPRRQEPDDALACYPDEQHQAAFRQYQRAEMLCARLQLYGIH
jgi:peptide/nickel transport system substrate-binding protein